MQLTRKQIIELNPALRRLDTLKLSGKTRIQIGTRIRRVGEIVEDIQEAQKKQMAQYGLTGQTKELNGQQVAVDDPAKTRDFNREWVATLAEPQEYQVGKFLLADLDLQTNNLAVSTLMQLLPVISDPPKVDTRKVALRRADMLSVAQALVRVDSQDKPLKLPYARKLALAELLVRLSTLVDELEVQRQKMIDSHKLGNYKQKADGTWESSDDAQALKQFTAEWAAMLQSTLEVDVPVISSNDLDLDTNNIPGSILADLLLILNEPAE